MATKHITEIDVYINFIGSFNEKLKSCQMWQNHQNPMKNHTFQKWNARMLIYFLNVPKAFHYCLRAQFFNEFIWINQANLEAHLHSFHFHLNGQCFNVHNSISFRRAWTSTKQHIVGISDESMLTFQYFSFFRNLTLSTEWNKIQQKKNGPNENCVQCPTVLCATNWKRNTI